MSAKSGCVSSCEDNEMCGRYDLNETGQRIRQHFKVVNPFDFAPRYNVAPSNPMPIVRASREGEREIITSTWGLVPWFSKESKTRYSTINARAETVERSAAYKEPFRRKRCLVPATGYYEWQKLPGGGKQPYRITSDSLVGFAGIYDRWGQGDESFYSYSIIVTDAADGLGHIHERMPVIVSDDDYDAWLSIDAGVDELKGMLRPYAAEKLCVYPVSTRVNKPANDDAALIEPINQG